MSISAPAPAGVADGPTEKVGSLLGAFRSETAACSAPRRAHGLSEGRDRGGPSRRASPVRRSPEPCRDLEVKADSGALVTVPDFAWPEAKLAVYCDGYQYHGDRDTLELDAAKRNFLQQRGWTVLSYWGRQILAHPERCARQVAEVHRLRTSAD